MKSSSVYGSVYLRCEKCDQLTYDPRSDTCFSCVQDEEPDSD